MSSPNGFQVETYHSLLLTPRCFECVIHHFKAKHDENTTHYTLALQTVGCIPIGFFSWWMLNWLFIIITCHYSPLMASRFFFTFRTTLYSLSQSPLEKIETYQLFRLESTVSSENTWKLCIYTCPIPKPNSHKSFFFSDVFSSSIINKKRTSTLKFNLHVQLQLSNQFQTWLHVQCYRSTTRQKSNSTTQQSKNCTFWGLWSNGTSFLKRQTLPGVVLLFCG